MLKIPGVDPQHVELYGDRYLALISSAKTHYHAVLREAGRPFDPNHQVVINVSSDSEDVADDPDLGGPITDNDDDDDNDYGLGETSTYFQQSQEVQDFNRRSKYYT